MTLAPACKPGTFREEERCVAAATPECVRFRRHSATQDCARSTTPALKPGPKFTASLRDGQGIEWMDMDSDFWIPLN